MIFVLRPNRFKDSTLKIVHKFAWFPTMIITPDACDAIVWLEFYKATYRWSVDRNWYGEGEGRWKKVKKERGDSKLKKLFYKGVEDEHANRQL